MFTAILRFVKLYLGITTGRKETLALGRSIRFAQQLQDNISNFRKSSGRPLQIYVSVFSA